MFHRYPDVPQPVLVKYDLKMPILPGHDLEEPWLRGSIFVNFQASQSGGDEDIDVMKLELDKKLIQLINAACEQVLHFIPFLSGSKAMLCSANWPKLWTWRNKFLARKRSKQPSRLQTAIDFPTLLRSWTNIDK